MNWKITKALIWKEGRETRWKWLIYCLAFNSVTIFTAISAIISLIFPSWFDSADGQNEVVYFTELSLSALVFQSIFLFTIGHLLVAFFASGVVAPEIRNRSIFFLLERPVTREFVLLHKFVFGAAQTIVSVGLSPLIFTTVLYALFFIVPSSDDILIPAAPQELSNIFAKSLHAGMWAGASSLIVFALAFLLSIQFEKQWFSVVFSAIILIALQAGRNRFTSFKQSFLMLTGTEINGKEMNIRPLEPLSIFAMILIAIALYFVAQFIFVRKELK